MSVEVEKSEEHFVARALDVRRSEMKLNCPVAILLLLASPALADQGDRSAVEALIESWNEGWRTKDAELAARGYSADADWINAFGMSERGREAITRRLREVFALPFVMGARSRVVKQEVRFVSAAVAVVITQVEREGQRTPSGEQLGVRRTSHQRVVVKEAGQWRVVSHLISDARDPQASQH
ncbi:MAG: SgcJ/EcaC family oxidoreductase [Myxococcaceae bacterium]|nr:MAG: SgcJ/EcaC family oxidoreductase [Myxococcaceae bacterium]